MVRIEDIHKSFDETEVLKGISLTFEKGKTNLIIGRSGAGKTVLLKTLVGLILPTSGTVWYDDINFTKLDKKALREVRMNIGMLFQGSALFDSLTVEENIRFPMDMFKKMTPGEKRKRIDYCLEVVGLEGSNNKFPSEISGGMQKRVGIARAIVLDPDYLFCDEPNSGLDPKTSLVVDELLLEITRNNNTTTIINTHDMNSVMGIGENIALLHQGKVAWQGNKDQIIESDNELLQSFIFASPFLKDLKERAYGH